MCFLLICVIFVFFIQRKISIKEKTEREIDQFEYERENYLYCVETEIEELLLKENYIYEVREEYDFKEKEFENIIRLDDYALIYAKVTPDFEEDKDIIRISEFAYKLTEKIEDIYHESRKNNASFYNECLKNLDMPGCEKGIFGREEFYLYIICGDNLYRFPFDYQYDYYLNGEYVDIKQYYDRMEYIKSGKYREESSSGKNNKSGSSYSNSNKNYKITDPDDYDSPEDFADDAWGMDFDDWDEAYDYWEDW